MRDQLFQYYVAFGHELHYLKAYSISARRIGNTYSGFLMLISAGGIAALSCWDKYPMVWALITVAAQILQVLKLLMQSSKQRQALLYIIQDASSLFDEIGLYWDTIGAYDPPRADDIDIGNKIIEFKRRFRECKDRFAADIDFPEKKRLEVKAKEANSKYFWYNYRVKIEEEF